MPTLANFPLVNQNTTVTGDGRPSENALYDCVAACIDAMCRYWLHTPENSVFNPDHFKDAAYGENWRNDGTDAARYVDFCKTLGINLYATTVKSQVQAIEVARLFIAQGIPVLLTEADPYVDASLGWTHACVFYADDGNGLTALDPFIGKPIYRSDASWEGVLRGSVLWMTEKENTMGVPNGWHDDGHVLYCPSHVQGGADVPITGPFRDYVLANAWRPSDRFIEHGHHVNDLQYNNTSLGGGFMQTSLWSMLLMPDSGPQAGKVIYAWLGVEAAFLRNAFEGALAHNADLTKQIATLQAELTKPVVEPAAVANRLTALAQLGHQVEALANQPI